MSNPFKLQNGGVLISTESAGGLYNAEQLRGIAELCERESLVVKATEDHRLALVVKEEQHEQISTELQAKGMATRHYQDGLHQPISCIGALCPSMEQDALSTAIELTQALAATAAKASLKIGINGCARVCVPTHTLDISVIGEANGYRVALGGKNSQIPEMASFIAEGVPAAELLGMIEKVVSIFNEQAEDGESLQDLLQRVGVSPFVDAFAPYSQDAASNEDPFGELPPAEPMAAAESSSDDMDSLMNEEPLPAPELVGEENTFDLDQSSDMDLKEELLVEESSGGGELNEDVLIEEPLSISDASSEIPATEDEELALEAKLEESIMQQEAMAEIAEAEAEDSRERNQALEMMEDKSSSVSLDSMSLDSFNDSTKLDGDLRDIRLAGNEFDEEDGGGSMQVENGLGGIQSININEEFVNLNFANGEALTIDVSKLKTNNGRRNFTINGQEITIRISGGGVKVGVDGIEVLIPQAA